MLTWLGLRLRALLTRSPPPPPSVPPQILIPLHPAARPVLAIAIGLARGGLAPAVTKQ